MKHYCYDCGTVFDDEEAGTLTEHHPEVHADEHFPCCPHCGSTEFGDAWQCEECGEWFGDEEFESFSGLCKECLKDKCTPDAFLEFALENVQDDNKARALEEFVFNYMWGIDCPYGTCAELIYLLVDAYQAHKYDSGFQKLIYAYFDGSSCGEWDDFGEWLAEKRRAAK